ncbi:hypothetical protein JCM3770_005798 [Rhodotorula araucariae]
MASPRAVAVAVLVVLPSLPSPSSSPAESSSSQGPVPEPTFLLVSSRKKQHLYVFPKGGVEHGESPDQAAQRESWEEAGLRPDSATHLAHLLTLADPSPHILSPSSNPASPSFVSSCEYSFELFLLPPPPPPPPAPPPSTLALSAAEAGLTPPALPLHASLAVPHAAPSSLSSDASASSAASSPSASTAPSPASHPPPAPLPTDVAPLAARYSAAYLAPEWPEARERHRRWVHGWRELERTVCWGRREGVMREAVDRARDWVAEWWARGGRIAEDADDDEDDNEDDDEEGEGAKGRL